MTQHRYNPLPADHPLVGEICPGCHKPFVPGDVVTLVALGPGDSEDEQARARDGQPYNAVAVPAHWACVTGVQP